MIKQNKNNRLAALEIITKCTSNTAAGASIPEIIERLKSSFEKYWPATGVSSKEFTARYPDKARLVAMAREVTKGRIQFWQPWHMEQTHTPEKLGAQINWEAQRNGDEEWPHALVRFTHMVDLAAAYRLTNDTTFLATYRRHLHNFFIARQSDSELWNNRLDSALRVLNLIRSHDLIREDPDYTDDDHLVLHALLIIESELLYSKIGERVGNWEFFITTSLLCSCLCLGKIFDITAWQNRSYSRLKEILKSEILPDGNLVEQVPMYHGQCVLALLDYLTAQKANSIGHDGEIVKLVRKMTTVLLRIADPVGFIPPIGDSDVFDIRYILTYCDAVLDTRHEDELPSALQTFGTDLAQVDLLKDTGWVVTRWHSSRRGTGFLLFDFSGRPLSGREGHSHADDLQFIFHTSRGPVLVDPGRFTYAPLFLSEFYFLPWRIRHSRAFRRLYSIVRPRFRELNARNWCRYFRHTLRHNTISCNGRNQSGYDDSPQDPTTVALEQLISDGPLVLCRGSLTSKDGYSHTREFICHVPHLLIIIDRLSADSPRDWIASFHFGTDLRVKLNGGPSVTASSGEAGYRIVFAEAHGAKAVVRLEDDWVSPVYNVKLPAKAVRVEVKNRTEATLISVVTLTSDLTDEAPTISRLGEWDEQHPANHRLRYKTENAEIEACLRLHGGSLSHAGITTDALYAFVQHREGVVEKVGYLDGSYLDTGRKRFSNGNEKASLHSAID